MISFWKNDLNSNICLLIEIDICDERVLWKLLLNCLFWKISMGLKINWKYILYSFFFMTFNVIWRSFFLTLNRLLPAGMIAKHLFIIFIICLDKEQKATQVSLKKLTYIFHILETVLGITGIQEVKISSTFK